jgi:uncharacterized protein YjiS (DUF1127 family)
MYTSATAGARRTKLPRRETLASIARRFVEALEHSRQRRALIGLPDHLLHDIGVTRADVMRSAPVLSRWVNVGEPAAFAQCDDGHRNREE